MCRPATTCWVQEGAGFQDFALDLSNPDFVKYAEAYGAKGYRIREVRRRHIICAILILGCRSWTRLAHSVVVSSLCASVLQMLASEYDVRGCRRGRVWSWLHAFIWAGEWSV